MNSKRRAELQRRLSMDAVPRPPADLAERIKADIPKYLVATPEPRRFAWGTTLRIAATLFTLLTTALVTLEVLEPKRQPVRGARTQTREQLTPAVLRYRSQQTAADTASAPRAETEVSLEIVQEPRDIPAEAAVATEAAPAPTAVAPPRPAVAQHRGNMGGVAAAAAEKEEPQLAFAESAAAPSAPPPAPPMAAPAPAAAANADSITVTASAPSLVREAHAAPLQLEQGDLFGISLDPAAFPVIRNAIQSGTRPAPGAVNVEALVNYFAGAQASRRPVALEVEASPAPIAADGDVAILRFTVDTARITLPARASVPPVARDAHLHVDIDPRAVASFRRVGDSGTEDSEEALLYNTSVTGLYELQLKPNLRATQRVATVRLQYISVK
ncbi:MAG TPA: von Willebrand factor type A domain-containing protein, partial [Thermoanaerobaculia bacterium]